jgi:hypothetical protein
LQSLADADAAVIQEHDERFQMRREQPDQLLEFFEFEEALPRGRFFLETNLRDELDEPFLVGNAEHPAQAGERAIDHRRPDALGETLACEPSSGFRVDAGNRRPRILRTVLEELVELFQSDDGVLAVSGRFQRAIPAFGVVVEQALPDIGVPQLARVGRGRATGSSVRDEISEEGRCPRSDRRPGRYAMLASVGTIILGVPVFGERLFHAGDRVLRSVYFQQGALAANPFPHVRSPRRVVRLSPKYLLLDGESQ